MNFMDQQVGICIEYIYLYIMKELLVWVKLLVIIISFSKAAALS